MVGASSNGRPELVLGPRRRPQLAGSACSIGTFAVHSSFGVIAIAGRAPISAIGGRGNLLYQLGLAWPVEICLAPIGRAATHAEAEMTKTARARHFESAVSAAVQPVSVHCGRTGAYPICPIHLDPSLVLARLLDVLRHLDPEAHARLTAPASAYRSTPVSAMANAEAAWWSAPGGSDLIAEIVDALNVAAHPQYVCDLRHDGHITLVPLPQSPLEAPPSSGRYRKIAAS